MCFHFCSFVFVIIHQFARWAVFGCYPFTLAHISELKDLGVALREQACFPHTPMALPAEGQLLWFWVANLFPCRPSGPASKEEGLWLCPVLLSREHCGHPFLWSGWRWRLGRLWRMGQWAVETTGPEVLSIQHLKYCRWDELSICGPGGKGMRVRSGQALFAYVWPVLVGRVLSQTEAPC